MTKIGLTSIANSLISFELRQSKPNMKIIKMLSRKRASFLLPKIFVNTKCQNYATNEKLKYFNQLFPKF